MKKWIIWNCLAELLYYSEISKSKFWKMHNIHSLLPANCIFAIIYSISIYINSLKELLWFHFKHILQAMISIIYHTINTNLPMLCSVWVHWHKVLDCRIVNRTKWDDKIRCQIFHLICCDCISQCFWVKYFIVITIYIGIGISNNHSIIFLCKGVDCSS